MEDDKPQFDFKQHIPKRFGRSYIIRMIIYISGLALVLGFLIQKWNNSDTNKKKIDVLNNTQNKEIEIEVEPEKSMQ